MNSRSQELENISDQQFDLCVIGGGATGSACALDAQLRGIRTVLLEGGDFAGATSSAATKIIHGGVRYLEEAIKGADLQEYRVLVRALHERVRMLENAPHLTRTLEFLVPSYHWIDVAYLDIGLKIYDWLAGPARISPEQVPFAEETLERMPELNSKGLVGSVAYADGQFDDARYNIALVQSFAGGGWKHAELCKGDRFPAGSERKDFWRVVKDQLTEDTFSVKAKAIVNATGPFSDSIRRLATPTLRKAHAAQQRRAHSSAAGGVSDRRCLADSKNSGWTRRVCDPLGRKAAGWNYGRRGCSGRGTGCDEGRCCLFAAAHQSISGTTGHSKRNRQRLCRHTALVVSTGNGDTKKLARDDVIEMDPDQRAYQHHGRQVDYASRDGGRHYPLCTASARRTSDGLKDPQSYSVRWQRFHERLLGKSVGNTMFLKQRHDIWLASSELRPKKFLL